MERVAEVDELALGLLVVGLAPGVGGGEAAYEGVEDGDGVILREAGEGVGGAEGARSAVRTDL